VPLLVVIALAVLFWYLNDRQPPAAPSTPAPPATNTAVAGDSTTEAEADAAALEAAAATTKDDATPMPDMAATSAADELAEPAALAASPASPTAIPPAETPTAAPTRGPPDRIEGLPVITLAELPPEALETLALIASDGPFPFRQDGTTFQNRERILPSRSTGYYREFTVVTPGASTRGARRIVGGAEGELYYTDDHYDSFARIWLP
jgi:guanyl-specific ribonuclease Sa